MPRARPGAAPPGPLALAPPPLAVAAQDRLAQHHLAVAVREGREGARRLRVAGLDVIVDRAEKLLEGVREALVVAAGIAGEAAGVGPQQGGVARQQLVGPVAA